MVDAVLQTDITLDDLFRMSQDGRVEIINGEWFEMAAVGAVHHMVGSNVYDPLQSFVKSRDLGVVFFDGMTFLMFSPQPRLKNSFEPDVSFISNENIPADWDPEKPHPGVPDFAVEVVSPSDEADKIALKVQTYLEKGTAQVLVLYAKAREVHQYRRSQPGISRIYRTGRIDLDELFPGFELTVESVFTLPEWAQKQMYTKH